MDLGLAGKKALVTGGSRGIGRGIVEALAAEGCDVSFCARNAEQVGLTTAALQGAAGKVSGASVDVADPEAVLTWVGAVAAAMGGIDIVVANVSALNAESSEAGWQTGFNVDLMGTVRTVNAALPFLRESTAASIVAIASTAALEAWGGVRAYNSIKAAIINYSSNLSADLAKEGIRVNTVSPGAIFFEGSVWDKRRVHDKAFYASCLAQIPLKRMGRPEEIGRAVAFLTSSAASYVTGTNLVVDGGLTKRVQY